ncbi:GAF domain-containing protein [Actinoplanes xinjiangensis]|uniref:GAF domain-containing protein n=1 Tax=Actinoplanes xinjiangensis TaxID=512350 RepID=A0A316FR25_9ACTN|nr:GAF domain-containing protein [Actinoplanes xinjiangensis]PWK50176.1 GAF domain-containing protein [Actinoplanes xinjiangensis]GIF36064.1 histidine kinase [Actinoplanes xinjiangensis]
MILERYPELRDRGRLLDVARLGMDVQVARPYLDEIVESVTDRLGMPFAIVDSLLDGAQVFLAGRGPIPEWVGEVGGTPIEWAFCLPMLRSRTTRSVSDLTTDPEFRDNPLVTIEGVRSYIGAPLISGSGAVLGGLCALDVRPREFDPAELDLMRDLADEVVRRIEARAEPDIMEP